MSVDLVSTVIWVGDVLNVTSRALLRLAWLAVRIGAVLLACAIGARALGYDLHAQLWGVASAAAFSTAAADVLLWMLVQLVDELINAWAWPRVQATED